MAIQTRNSVLAIVVEATEGTPVKPTAATEYTALQDDFTMSPSFNVLENAELKASLGPSKSILGMEAPTASFSHYWRASGTAGTAPDYNELLKAAFGTEVAASAEYDTIAASTVTTVKVDTGEGVNFQRGQALLVKHASNAWEIRPVHSVATDNLTVGFDLANAPAVSVKLGKAVLYKPANSGHQTLTLWHYVGNSGAIQMISGTRVTEISIEIPAGELINASFSLEGIEFYFNPVVIAAADRYLDFTSDNGTFAAIITADTYKDPHELAAALQTAMNTADPLETFTVVYSDSTGKFTIATTTSALLSLLWNTGTNTANTVGDKIGFLVAADDTGAITYTADNAMSWTSPYTPGLDSADPLVAKDNQLMIGDHDDFACVAASNVSITFGTPKADIMSICAASGKSGSIINAREVTVSVTALLDQHDVDKFERFRANDETRLCYVYGSKSGGNWEAGKCGCFYLPTATITSFNLADADGMVTLEMELTAFVDSSGNGEFYANFI